MTVFRSAQDQMRANMLVKHFAGSLAYGTSLPTSDVDFRGIFVADPVSVRTPFFRVDEVEDTAEADTKLYELANFMKLALDCNPNVVETLWVDIDDVVQMHPAYQLLRDAAPKLLSRKIAFTTSGYALAQLKRIRGHNKWINNPMPEAKPQACEFVSLVQHFPRENERVLFPRDFEMSDWRLGYRLVPFGKDVFGMYESAGYATFNSDTGSLNDDFDSDKRSELGAPKFVVKYNRAEHEDAKVKWEQYWTWKKNRNVARNELEQQFGYDTKHAMHLVRLMRMGKEALTEGVIHVKRADAAELLDVRNGKWTYEQVLEYAEMMDADIKGLVERSVLPAKVDLKVPAQLILDIQDQMWNRRD